MGLKMSGPRKAIIILALVAAILLGLGAIALVSTDRWLGPAVRTSVVEKLERRFKSKVEIEALGVSFFPPLQVTASKVRLHHRGRTDVPPLITMNKLIAHIDPWGLVRKPVHVRSVELQGVEILIPPRGSKRNQDRIESTKDGAKAGEAEGGTARTDVSKKKNLKDRYPFFVEKIDIDDAVLKIQPKKPGGDPLMWQISRLRLQSVGMDRPMNFDASLTNAKPPGLIRSGGQFGPWQEDDPGQTFVAGAYTFKDADLSVFKGIAGRLSSQGSYRGVLEQLQVHGTTDTPDFRVTVGGQRVHMSTEFDAVVDGTSGDTLLEPIKVRIEKSSLTARGGAIKLPGTKGKTIKLHVTLSDGRVEDLLRLAVKSNAPFLVGGIRFDAEFLLPPGDQEITDKLDLGGQFAIRSARFTSPGVRDKLEEFSWRARGRPKEEQGNPDQVVSNMGGRFVLKNGLMTFSKLSFGIPGAMINLNGTYTLRNEQLGFEGDLRMQAKLSETVSGVKSLALKLVDPFFSKQGAGTVLPIKIEGTQEKPEFGLNFRKLRGKKN